MRQALWLSFQVSDPGSPGAGMVKVRHASLPVSTSKAPTQLRVPCEPPVLSPWTTSSRAAGGLDGQRRARERLGLGRRAGLGILRRGRLDLPGDLAGVAVERDQARVIGGEEDLVAVHGEPAGGARARDLGVVAPQRHRRGAAAHVELHHPRPGVGHIHEAVVHQRGRFLLAAQRAAGRASADREHELELEVLDGVAIDGLERGMPAVVVVVVDHQPVLRLGRGVLQPLRRDIRGQARRGGGARWPPRALFSVDMSFLPSYSFTAPVIADT